jgi:membrane protease YdiL (CAAX protease family)
MIEVDRTVNRNNSKPVWGWKDLFIILLGIGGILIFGIMLYLVTMIIIGVNPETLMQPTAAQSIGLAGLEALALILGVYLFGLRRRGYGWNAVGLRSTSSKWLLISAIATFIAIPLTSIIILLVFFAFSIPLENPQLDFLLPEELSSTDILLMLILAGFAAPFGEELLFRGVLYRTFRERWGIWPSVLLSSLIFGAIHGNLAVGLTGFLLGILTAIVFEYSQSLWTAILVHAINNTAKIGLLYLLVSLGFSV